MSCPPYESFEVCDMWVAIALASELESYWQPLLPKVGIVYKSYPTFQHICWQCYTMLVFCVLNLCDMQWGCGIQNVVSDFVRRRHTFNETWNSEMLGVSFLWGNCRTCKKHTSFYCLNFIGQAQNPLRTKELSLNSIRTRSSSIARWFGNMTASCSCLQGCRSKIGSQNVKRFEVNSKLQLTFEATKFGASRIRIDFLFNFCVKEITPTLLQISRASYKQSRIPFTPLGRLQRSPTTCQPSLSPGVTSWKRPKLWNVFWVEGCLVKIGINQNHAYNII